MFHVKQNVSMLACVNININFYTCYIEGYSGVITHQKMLTSVQNML